MTNEGFVIWFTGWSGAGKTTIAVALEEYLKNNGIKHVQRLDGDIVREELTKDLGFSKEDRNENIRRITFVAELLSKNGVATIVSFISPYRKARDTARQKCNNFIEVYVKCDRNTLIQRDVKGLYKKAINGEISDFTGINDPYEEPLNPEIVIETSKENIQESLDKVIRYLEKNNFV